MTVSPVCDAIWSADNGAGGPHRKPRCNTGSSSGLPYRERRIMPPKVRAYALDPFVMQVSINAWRAISLQMLFKYLPNFLLEMSIFSFPLAGGTLAPGVKAAFRDREYTAHYHYWKLTLMLFNKLIFHRWSREKMLTTFFRISRSCCTLSNSRFKREISSSKVL